MVLHLLSDRFHDPRNASGTGSGKNRFHVRDGRVLHDPGPGPGPGLGSGCPGSGPWWVPDAMGSRPIRSGTGSGTPTFNWSQKGPGRVPEAFLGQCETPPFPGHPFPGPGPGPGPGSWERSLIPTIVNMTCIVRGFVTDVDPGCKRS